jgi:hypothetical protein
MSYRGKVKDGVVVLEAGIRLAEGTEVEVQPVAEAPRPPAEGLGQRLLKHAGAAKGYPSDLARNHDHYIHGTPRESK